MHERNEKGTENVETLRRKLRKKFYSCQQWSNLVNDSDYFKFTFRYRTKQFRWHWYFCQHAHDFLSGTSKRKQAKTLSSSSLWSPFPVSKKALEALHHVKSNRQHCKDCIICQCKSTCEDGSLLNSSLLPSLHACKHHHILKLPLLICYPQCFKFHICNNS